MSPRLPDCHKGSVSIVTLMSIVSLVVVIVCAWWGLVIVPKNKAAETRKTQAWVESLVASKSFLYFPSTQTSCDVMGGIWQVGQDRLSVTTIVPKQPGKNMPLSTTQKQRIRTPDFCSMPASDAGNTCTSSSECESFCVGRMMLGELFTAQCYPYRNAGPNSSGSLHVVENGRLLYKLSFTPVTKRTADTYEILAAQLEIQVLDDSKLKIGDKVRATKELRDRPWFPSVGIPGT